MVDFDIACEEAKDHEKSALEYTAYSGKIVLKKELDLSPKEFSDYSYIDLVNLYERAEKIIKASHMEIYGAPSIAKTKKMTAKTEEVESKVKELTGDALKSAQELGEELEKKPIGEIKPEVAPKPVDEEIEFERLTPDEFEVEEEADHEVEEEEEPLIELEKEIELEEKAPERAAPPIELEKEEKPEIEIEKPEEKPEVKVTPVEKAVPKIKPPKRVVPPILRERAEIAGEKKFEEIEEQIMATLGEKTDEVSLKKKMLELTKELFKEKSVKRRERIKLEITVLKNMFKKKVKAPKKGMGEQEAKERLLTTLVSTQQKEIAATKDKVLTNYKHQIGALKEKFLEKAQSLPETEEGQRKKIYEKMVFELTALSEQLPQIILKYQNYLKEKHETEIRKLRSSLAKKETKLMKKTDDRLVNIDENYAKEFATARAIVKKQIEFVIEAGSRVVFKAEKVPVAQEKIAELVHEINETDDGTLLYFLHGKDAEFYKNYERKHVSKQEAIFRAKALMAKEKGLSDDMISKYFSESEG
jgi:hypothetical protein